MVEKLAELLKGAGLEAWKIENEEMFSLMEYEEGKIEIIEDDARKIDFNGKVAFVDGKIRHLLRSRDPFQGFLLSHVVVGSAFWDPSEGFKMGEITSFLVLTLGSRINANMQDLKGEILGHELRTVKAKSPDLTEEAKVMMAEEEYSLALKIARDEDAVVIKDGTLKPIFEAKEEKSYFLGKGPIGLVKNIQSFLSKDEELSLVRGLGMGDRSRAFSKRYMDVWYISSYLRIGRRSYIRLDAAVKELSEEIRRDVLDLFSKAAFVIPKMTLDVDWKRYPENIFPIASLESYLKAYLLSPQEVLVLLY